MGNFKSHHFVSDCHSDFVEELASTLPERKLEIGGLIPRKRDVKVQMQEKDVEILSLECKDEFIPRTSLVGGKARRLMELHKMEAKNFSVPKGMVVTTLAFKKHVLDELGCTYKRANEAREKILAFEVPKAFAESIERSLDEKTWYAVRSSATVEDGAKRSMAGIAETFLFVRKQDVVQKVVSVWASLYEERAQSYLENLSEEPLMAVVIQEMVNAAVSGVAFSLHPSYGVDNVMSVECVYGAGEALVSGKVTPYAFNVDWVEKTVQKEGKEDEEKQDHKMIRSEGEGGLVKADLSEAEREKNPLTDAQLLEISNAILEICLKYGSPQDVEFCVDENDKVFVVQTRPITKFSCARVSCLAMSISSISGYYHAKTLGLKEKEKAKEKECVKMMFGDAYVNSELSKSQPVTRLNIEKIQSFLTHSNENAWLKIVGNLNELTEENLRKAVLAILYEKRDLGMLSFYVGDICRELEREIELQMGPEALEEALVDVRPASGEQQRDLNSLVAMARENEETRKLFLEEEEIFDALRKETKYSEFYKEFEKFLLKFYFLCENDEDILETRFFENPLPVIAVIKMQVGMKENKTEKKQKPLPTFKGDQLKLRQFLVLKDEIHELYTKYNFVMCKMCLEYAKRIGLEQPNDIFQCFHRSLEQALVDKEKEKELKEEIEIQKKKKLMFRNFEAPRLIFKRKPFFKDNVRLEMEQEEAEATFQLLGKGASAGTAKGRVCVCHTLEDTKHLKQGDVLVTTHTSPAWTIVFSSVCAVVTEMGGRLSHAAVVAREMEMPAVLSVSNATKLLRTGDVVTVDGDSGLVSVKREMAEKKREEEEKEVEEDEEYEDLAKSRDELTTSRN